MHELKWPPGADLRGTATLGCAPESPRCHPEVAAAPGSPVRVAFTRAGVVATEGSAVAFPRLPLLLRAAAWAVNVGPGIPGFRAARPRQQNVYNRIKLPLS